MKEEKFPESKAEIMPEIKVNAEADVKTEPSIKHKNKREREKFFTTRNLTVTATLTAISYILYMFVKFPLPGFPPFLDIQFSDMPALIGGFMMGPLTGCIIIVLKCLLKMPLSQTLCVGELADILVGIAFVLPAALIYQKHKTKKGAFAALGFGSLSAVVMSLLANSFMLIPLYSLTLPGGMQTLVNMMSPLFPAINANNFLLYYLPLSILPFNLIRCVICALITFLLYKAMHKLINSMFKRKKKAENMCVNTPKK